MTLARTGSFAAAADALGTTPRALSRSVRELERITGEPLIASGTRDVRLSPAGESLARSAGRVLGALERFKDAASSDAHTLRVAHVPGSDTLSGILDELLVSRPDLRLHETAADESQQLRDLVERRLDVAVCPARPELPEQLEAVPIRLDGLVVLGDGIELGEPCDLSGRHVVAPVYASSRPQHEAVLEQFEHESGARLERVAIAADSGQQLASLLRCARGRLAVVPSSSAGVARLSLTQLRWAHGHAVWHVIWRTGDHSEETSDLVAAARRVAARHGWMSLSPSN